MSSPESARPEGKKKRKKNPQSQRRRLVFICKGMNRTVNRPKTAFQAFRTRWKDFPNNILTFLPVKRKRLQTDMGNKGKYETGASRKPVFV